MIESSNVPAQLTSINKNKEQIRVRIAKKGIYAEDIKHSGRLSADEIATLDTEKVYTWVRTGAWKPKDFEKWLKVMRVIE